jgi:alkylated DNA repair dioxygenase AlkB
MSSSSNSSINNISTDNKIKLSEGESWFEYIDVSNEINCDEKIFKELLDLKPKERGKVIVFGKEFDVPRWQQSFGQDYYFSGLNHRAVTIEHPFLIKILEFVKKHSGQEYKQMLINWYLDGNEYISPHSDDEKQLVENSTIYSFSFGSTRDFVITSKKSNFRQVIPLEHNTLILMGGEMQKYYKHAVPKRLKVKEPRINITLRLYK